MNVDPILINEKRKDVSTDFSGCGYLTHDGVYYYAGYDANQVINGNFETGVWKKKRIHKALSENLLGSCKQCRRYCTLMDTMEIGSQFFDNQLSIKILFNREWTPIFDNVKFCMVTPPIEFCTYH